MKVYYFLAYYLFAFFALITIPLVETAIYPITKEFNIKQTYNLWLEHYKSGRPWGHFDRGKP